MWGLFSAQVRKKSWACFVLYLLSYIQIVQKALTWKDQELRRVFLYTCEQRLVLLREKGMNEIQKGAGKNTWIGRRKFIKKYSD